jgi:hypothetical protein
MSKLACQKAVERLAISMIAAVLLSACASSFQVTNSFDVSAEAGALGGGGGCSGDVFVATQERIFSASGTPSKATGIFLRDFWCANGPVAISIEGKSYVLEPVEASKSPDFFQKTGLHPVYENSRQKLVVKLALVERLKSVLDPATECVTRYNKLAVNIQFKGAMQNLIGFTGGGCP